MDATHDGNEMAQPRSPRVEPLRDRLKPSMQLGGEAASRRVGRRDSIALSVTIPFVLLLSALMAWLALRRRCLPAAHVIPPDAVVESSCDAEQQRLKIIDAEICADMVFAGDDNSHLNPPAGPGEPSKQPHVPTIGHDSTSPRVRVPWDALQPDQLSNGKVLNPVKRETPLLPVQMCKMPWQASWNEGIEDVEKATLGLGIGPLFDHQMQASCLVHSSVSESKTAGNGQRQEVQGDSCENVPGRLLRQREAFAISRGVSESESEWGRALDDGDRLRREGGTCNVWRTLSTLEAADETAPRETRLCTARERGIGNTSERQVARNMVSAVPAPLLLPQQNARNLSGLQPRKGKGFQSDNGQFCHTKVDGISSSSLPRALPEAPRMLGEEGVRNRPRAIGIVSEPSRDLVGDLSVGMKGMTHKVQLTPLPLARKAKLPTVPSTQRLQTDSMPTPRRTQAPASPAVACPQGDPTLALPTGGLTAGGGSHSQYKTLAIDPAQRLRPISCGQTTREPSAVDVMGTQSSSIDTLAAVKAWEGREQPVWKERGYRGWPTQVMSTAMDGGGGRGQHRPPAQGTYSSAFSSGWMKGTGGMHAQRNGALHGFSPDVSWTDDEAGSVRASSASGWSSPAGSEISRSGCTCPRLLCIFDCVLVAFSCCISVPVYAASVIVITQSRRNAGARQRSHTKTYTHSTQKATNRGADCATGSARALPAHWIGMRGGASYPCMTRYPCVCARTRVHVHVSPCANMLCMKVMGGTRRSNITTPIEMPGDRGVSFYQGRSSLHGRMLGQSFESVAIGFKDQPIDDVIRDEDEVWG